MAQSRGFTLLELLVSISIFSVLGMGAYRMLETVVDSHDRVRETSEGYTRMNLALTIMQRDFTQFVARPVRDEYGEALPPLIFEGEDYQVEFTRTGWSNPAGRQRSRLQRVAYSLDFDEKTLTRHFWDVLDRAEDSEVRSQLLLEDVTDFRVTGFTEDDLGGDRSFDLDTDDGVVPLAVEVMISTEGLGEVTRLFQLVEVYTPERLEGGAPGDSEGALDDEPGTGDENDAGNQATEDQTTGEESDGR